MDDYSNTLALLGFSHGSDFGRPGVGYPVPQWPQEEAGGLVGCP